MSWENDAASYIAEMSRSPGARQPASIGEVWSAEWTRTGLDTIAGVGEPYAAARGDFVAAIEGAAGKSLEDYAAEKGVLLGGAVSQADDIRLLGELADTLPEDRRKAIAPLKDIRLNAQKKALKIEADANDVAGATYGLSAHAVAFLAGVARQSADPVNIAAMVATAPLGAARGAGLLATVGREAAANAAAQAAVEPVIEPARERLGLDAGVGRAAGNVLEAAIGGGALSGLFHAAGRGIRATRSGQAVESVQPGLRQDTGDIAPTGETRLSESANPAQAPSDNGASGVLAASRAGDGFAAADFEAAARLAERDHLIDQMSPIDTAEGRLEHAAGVEVAARAVDEGVSVSDLLAREGVRLPPQIERLSELQLGEIARHAADLDEIARSARADLDRRIVKADAGQAALDERGTRVSQMRQEVADIAGEIEAIKQKIGGLEDPATAARLQAINDEAAGDISRARRADLAAERQIVLDTVAAERPGRDRQRASLHQELAGLQRLHGRKERAAAKAASAHDAALAAAREGRLDLIGQIEMRDATRASQRDIITNELRRAISTLAGDGYGVRLSRADAQELADIILLSAPDNLGRVLEDVSRNLIDRAAGARTDAIDRLAAQLVGIARLNGRELDGEVSRSLASQISRADNNEIASIIDRVVGTRPVVTLSDVALPEKFKADPIKTAPEAPRPATMKQEINPAKIVSPELMMQVEVDRVLASAGDIDIVLIAPDGTSRTLKASQALQEVGDDARAVAELNSCIAGG